MVLHSPFDSPDVYSFDGFSVYYSPTAPSHWPAIRDPCISVLISLGLATHTLNVQLETHAHTVCLEPRHVCLIPAEQRYVLQLSEPGEFMVIRLEPSLLQAQVQNILLTPDWSIEGQYAIYDGVIEAVAQGLVNYLEDTAPVARFYRKSSMQFLATHLMIRYASARFKRNSRVKEVDHARILKALNYIHSNLDHELHIKTLAEVVDLSDTYFCKLFKRSVGVSPYQYILSQRIELARQLLESTSISLFDVSYQCGFCDQSHFIRQFRRFMGTTPKMYRDRNGALIQ